MADPHKDKETFTPGSEDKRQSSSSEDFEVLQIPEEIFVDSTDADYTTVQPPVNDIVHTINSQQNMDETYSTTGGQSSDVNASVTFLTDNQESTTVNYGEVSVNAHSVGLVKTEDSRTLQNGEESAACQLNRPSAVAGSGDTDIRALAVACSTGTSKEKYTADGQLDRPAAVSGSGDTNSRDLAETCGTDTKVQDSWVKNMQLRKLGSQCVLFSCGKPVKIPQEMATDSSTKLSVESTGDVFIANEKGIYEVIKTDDNRIIFYELESVEVPGENKSDTGGIESDQGSSQFISQQQMNLATVTETKGGATPGKPMIPNKSDIAVKKQKLQAKKDDTTETTFAVGRQTCDDFKVGNSVPNSILQKQVSLVKLYAWIKDEMSKTSARSIADDLFQNRLLSGIDHEAIWDCSWRRDAVEQLLKKILIGPNDIFDTFLQSLQEPETHIAVKLQNTYPTQDEVDVFKLLEKSSRQRGPRPDHTDQRFFLTESDFLTLLCQLNDKNSIDVINSSLLSQFFFSIREHTNICVCSMDSEGRVRELLNTMKLCSDKIFSSLCQILTVNEREHVVGRLERNRQMPVNEDASAEDQPCRPDNSYTEHRLLTSMQASLVLHTLEQLGFYVGNVKKGSIVIEVYPASRDSWRQLEENCTSGKIKDCISEVYNNDAIQDLLQEGVYPLQFTIYIQTDQEGGKKALFHLGTEHEAHQQGVPASDVGHHDSPIDDYMDLLCEELEISTALLKLLKEQKIVEDNIKEDIEKQGSRAKKNKYLLNQVSRHGNRGYEVLKQHIKEANEDLYKELGTYNKHVFFSGTAILKVEPTEKDDIGPDTEKRKLEISCPEIINSVCHFTSKSDTYLTPISHQLTRRSEGHEAENTEQDDDHIYDSIESGTKPKPLHTVTIVKGSVENIQADVIVNTTSYQLKLDVGCVSTKLLNKAGPELQNECNRKCPKGIHYGEIIHTAGYCLNCHHVLHGALDGYHDKASLQKLQRFVIDCMRKMVALKHRTIAFPAIGTGNLRYPKDQVAVIMYRAVDEFLSSYTGSDHLNIIFVLWAGDTETVKAFEDAEHKRAIGRLERFAPLTGFTKDLLIGGVTISAELGSLDTVKAQSIIYLWDRQNMHSAHFSGHPLLKHLGSEQYNFTKHRNDKVKRSEVLTTSGGQLPFIQKVVHVPCEDNPTYFTRAFKDGLLAADKGGMISAAVLFPANHPLLKHGDKVAHALIEAVKDVFPAHLSTLTDVCLMIEGNHNFSKVKAYMDSYLDKYGVPPPPLTAGSKVKVSTGKVAVKVIGLKGNVEEANRELTRQLDRRKLTETARVQPLEQITPQITLTSAPPDLTMPRGAEGGGVPQTPLTEGSKVNVTTGKVAVKVIGLEQANRELTTQLDRKQLTETIRVFTNFRTTMNPSIVAAAKQKGILGDLVEELKIIDVCVDVDGDKTELVMKTVLQLQQSMQIIEEFAANSLQLKRQTIISDCMDIDSATCSSIAWDVCQIVKKSLLVKIRKQKISVSYIDGKILIDRAGPESVPDNVRVLVTELKEFLSNEFEEIPIDGSGQDADRWCSEIEKFVGSECCIYVPEKNAIMAYGGQYDRIQLIRHKVNIKQGKVKQTARGRPQSAMVASGDLLRSLPNAKSAVRQPPRKRELPVASDKESAGNKPTDDDSTADDCVICMDTITDPKSLKCGHKFCRECIDESFKHKKVCPMCGAVCGTITGDQPPGTIQVYLAQHQHCMGYESVGQLQITYNFPSGHQGAEHPTPGQRYRGISRTGYLPDNTKGWLICKMLQIAFERRLVFTIGDSRTTGQKGVITWNDICHKTDPTPHTQFGYPDPSYLDRVIDELWAKGVTEADVPESSRI